MNRRKFIFLAASAPLMAAAVTSAQSASASSQLGLAFEYAFQQRAIRLAWGQSEWAANVGAFNTFFRNARGLSTWSEVIGKAMPYGVVATVGVLSIGEYARLSHDGWQIFKKKDGGATTPGSTDQIRSAVGSGGVITYDDTGSWYYAYYAFGKAYDFPPGYGLIGSWADATGGSWVLAFKPKAAAGADERYPPLPVSAPTSYSTAIPWADAGAAVDADTMAAALSAAMSNVAAGDQPFINTDFPPLTAGALNEAPTSTDIPASQSSASTSASASASAGSSSSTSAADTSGSLPALPSVPDPAAWFNSWANSLNPLMPSVPAHAGACPALPLPKLVSSGGSSISYTTFDATWHCALGEAMKPTLRTFAAIGASLSSLFIIMRS